MIENPKINTRATLYAALIYNWKTVRMGKARMTKSEIKSTAPTNA